MGKPIFIFGIYETGLHDEEKEFYPHIELGKLDHELKMARLKLRRSYQIQKRFEEQMNLEIQYELGLEDMPATAPRLKILDHTGQINLYTKLIMKLEIVHKQLTDDLSKKDVIEEFVSQFREFSDQAVATLPGGAM